MKKLLPLLLLLCLSTAAMAQLNLNKVAKALGAGEHFSAEEAGAGIKEALINGASKGSDLVSQADGFYKNQEIKIPFPPEMKKVEDRLRQVGMGSEVDKFILALNRAAEDAATEAKPIFVNAIKQMSIQDAVAIVRGEQDAATQYLNRTTSPQLQEKFKPIVQASLEKVNATQYYADLINAYNKIPLVQKMNPDLDDYATKKAIDGLFVMVAKEEKNIRQNPGARSSEILKKVFGSQK